MHYMRSLAELNWTDLPLAGGKGANLGVLIQAGLPVPPGFCITTAGYRAFVAENSLDAALRPILDNARMDDPASLESASSQIRACFHAAQIPPAVELEIRQGYRAMANAPPAVAVRSSATAEDLPDLSFAGQQDTVLNVVGEDQLLAAVVICWSSLWTARAIGYRARNGIAHDDVSMAVVVQQMVQSEASGVLFTANPLTGLLSESVVDATLGLGEALVSGQVEPDHFVVDVLRGAIRHKTLGAKQISTRSKPGGGVETIAERAAARQTLTDSQIRELVDLGRRVQEEYCSPQDVEWAFADGHFRLLQSRAITSLFPVPEVSFDPLLIWFSFGVVQGLLGPITPLGRDAIRGVVAGAGTMFGVRIELEEIDLFATAGERIWIKISDVVRHPIGNRLWDPLLGYLEPSVAQILGPLAADPRLGAGTGRLKFSTVRRLVRFALPILMRMAGNMLHPEKARAAFEASIEAYLGTAQIAPGADRFGRLANITAFVRNRIANAFAFLLPQFLPIFGPSMAALNLLHKIAGQDGRLALEVTRGLPNNVTTEMDLALWETASALGADAGATRLFRKSDARVLARRYLAGTLPETAQATIAGFMGRYGMRGVGEIDLGRQRWREDPTPVMHTLQSYLDIDAESSPDVLFARGEQAARAAVETLAAKARRQRGGWLKQRLVRAAARRIHVLMGARESPKFFAVRTMGIARSAILEVGHDFAKAGTLDRPDDLFFLRLSELETLSRNEPHDWRGIVAGRRAAYEREVRRRQVPRVLVSDGRAFYQGLGAETGGGDVITGSPVSPGVVEGVVHVVLDPHGTHLEPGEILVCPGTDPAWTPLFMAAGGLVTEVGGMMTHGSVVAREYGIPAVVGVHRATERFKDGQRIRLDGTTGEITALGPGARAQDSTAR
jgi:phosphoenolpyruvate synthase/pyruvate phosphate dikinase